MIRQHNLAVVGFTTTLRDDVKERKMRVKGIHHVALIVDDLGKSRDFYTNVLGLEELPALAFDYPVQFYQINETEQLHLTEWKDAVSFRGHFCLEVDDFNAAFY